MPRRGHGVGAAQPGSRPAHHPDDVAPPGHAQEILDHSSSNLSSATSCCTQTPRNCNGASSATIQLPPTRRSLPAREPDDWPPGTLRSGPTPAGDHGTRRDRYHHAAGTRHRSPHHQKARPASNHLRDGPLEAGGLVPRSRLRGIRVGFLSEHVRHQVLAVDGQTLERLTLIAGGQRVDDDAVLLDAGKALLKVGAVHRVVQTPPSTTAALGC
jgi:hypothetical protein